MRSFLLNKLIRDKIVIDMLSLGQQISYRRLGDEEYIQRLVEKLVEEAKEIKITEPEEAIKELADMLEVIETLGAELGADFDSIQVIQAERRKQRGGFEERSYVEKVTLQDDDTWAEYYGSDPDKYKEVTE